MDRLEISLFPKGIIKAPPSKSMGHRALICAALCKEPAQISNIGTSLDIKATLACLSKLGAEFQEENDSVFFQKGIGNINKDKMIVLDCAESGSTLRFLIPLVAVMGSDAKFIGHGRLMERPLTPYIHCLGQKGVTLTMSEGELNLKGKLRSGKFYLDGNISSQFVSGLLFALPLLKGDSEIILTTPLESKAYVDMTMATLSEFGVDVINEDYGRFIIKGNSNYKAKHFTVEGDYSGAAFFLVCGAIGADVTVSGLNPHSVQGDAKILDILKRAGADIVKTKEGIKVTAKKLNPLTIDVSEIPDLVPPLAVLFCFCQGESHIINAARLRIKESDRLAAVTQELNRLGARITEQPEGLDIVGVAELRGGDALAHNDHRIAMMIAAAAIRSLGRVTVSEPSCVNKSYPSFWDDFLRVKKD